MNRRRLLRLQRAGLIQPRRQLRDDSPGTIPRATGVSASAGAWMASQRMRRSRVSQWLPWGVAVVVIGVVLWGLVSVQRGSEERVHMQTVPVLIDAVSAAVHVIPPASVPQTAPASRQRASAVLPAVAAVDVDALMRQVVGPHAASAVQDTAVLDAIHALGEVWRALSPNDRARAMHAMADAIVARRDVPRQLHGVVAAMSRPMRDDVFALLEFNSDVAPLPAAMFVSP